MTSLSHARQLHGGRREKRLAVSAAACTLALLSASTTAAQEPAASPDILQVLEAVNLLRRDVHRDYAEALARVSTDRAAERFAALDAVLWTELPPQQGWSYFFGAKISEFLQGKACNHAVGCAA